ncbi:5'-AMP-activated protein kinase regulatory beta subunit [Paragonimus heterotremus]|uniref:5'-AMP-activated protein kinase subunit beta-1 n=1 Tax=Paragonimus heterotremus TaxID=100268 RepID=A0A8J4WP42_9TREM|nr:5'-AMP-activated protein kinase regulatory beta subunit [Paragonimus heterotremus]
MGNTSGGHKRRSSLDDDFPSGKRSMFQETQDYAGDDSVISILTEGIAINAIADQLRDSRICNPGDRAKLYVGGGTDGPEETVTQNVPTVFKWEGVGKDVYISGTFNGWKSKIPMVRSSSKQNFYTIVDLPLGEHQYKFIVDGQWKLDQNQPVTTSPTGVQNNVIQVRESDFDVLTALSHDIASSRGGATNDDSPNATLGATPARNDGTGYHENADSDNYLSGGGSPPGDYGRVIPSSPLAGAKLQSGTQGGGNTAGGGQLGSAPPSTTHSSSDSKKAPTPPMLPPQLLQVILNRDTNVQCDPNLLPQPDHVMVNHMYALSIKDGVIVLSAITRYRQKFVSTVLYKPI